MNTFTKEIKAANQSVDTKITAEFPQQFWSTLAVKLNQRFDLFKDTNQDINTIKQDITVQIQRSNLSENQKDYYLTQIEQLDSIARLLYFLEQEVEGL